MKSAKPDRSFGIGNRTVFLTYTKLREKKRAFSAIHCLLSLLSLASYQKIFFLRVNLVLFELISYSSREMEVFF